MRFKLSTLLAVSAAMMCFSAAASAQFGGGVVVCTNCASEPTVVSIKLMHDLEYAKQLLQYAIQVQQLADAIKNTAHGGAAALNYTSADLAQLANVVQGGQALAYSLGNQDVVFRTTFPGYQPVSGAAPAVGSYQSRYSQWAQTSLATTQGILRGVGLQGKLLATEQGVLSILRALSASNLLNRNDAINLSSQLATEQIGQLQKLRELQLEDMTSKAAFQGYVIQRQAASEAATQQFFKYTPEVSDGTTFQSGWK
ncbi:MAG TPA: P-type conjugative transfer protein TrbJ [Bryobacteraceae bacterium]|jgi:P-type conjugative transfer protein TrbJ|nr:P-type conjugative transfer protein TrbJ [Bryobacteraceae bacterium]